MIIACLFFWLYLNVCLIIDFHYYHFLSTYTCVCVCVSDRLNRFYFIFKFKRPWPSICQPSLFFFLKKSQMYIDLYLIQFSERREYTSFKLITLLILLLWILYLRFFVAMLGLLFFWKLCIFYTNKNNYYLLNIYIYRYSRGKIYYYY